jgi:hypothetical protein
MRFISRLPEIPARCVRRLTFSESLLTAKAARNDPPATAGGRPDDVVIEGRV